MVSLGLLLVAATCPWLNAATAQGILKEPVTEAFTPSAVNKQDGVCEFAGKHVILRIQVTTMTDIPKQFAGYLVRCGKNPEHLRGIGNDAVACGSGAAEVISRVRERALRVSATSADRKSLNSEVRTAAEEVAGSLF